MLEFALQAEQFRAKAAVSTGCAYTDSPSRGPPLCAAPSFNNRQLVFASN
jgi:hypothetical protein